MATFELAPITVLMGHAGVGKTNVALGFALGEASQGRQVTLVDMDVVNPYFRSSDYPDVLDKAGIRLIAPVLARTTLDTPSLTGELDAVIEQASADANQRVIIDVGGDDDGATTIGRWSSQLRDANACVLYVVSAFRALTQVPEAAAAMLPDIQDHAHLTAQAVLNTSNMGDQTTMADVAHGRSFARDVARLCELPLAATVVPEVATAGGEPLPAAEEPLVVMPRHIRLPWD